MTTLSELAGDLVFPILVVPVGGGTAGTAETLPGMRMPFRGQVTAAYWTPRAAITADPTNNFVLSIINKTTAGAGTAKPVTRSYAATNSVAHVPEAMTLDATAANLQFAAGDFFAVDKAINGTGLSMPQGVITLHVKVR